MVDIRSLDYGSGGFHLSVVASHGMLLLSSHISMDQVLLGENDQVVILT